MFSLLHLYLKRIVVRVSEAQITYDKKNKKFNNPPIQRARNALNHLTPALQNYFEIVWNKSSVVGKSSTRALVISVLLLSTIKSQLNAL